MERSLYALCLILPFFLLELGIVAWYFLYWDLFPKKSAKRLIPWFIFLLSLLAIPIIQIGIYRKIYSVEIVDNLTVYLIIVLESLFSTVLIFYLLRRRSKKVRAM